MRVQGWYCGCHRQREREREREKAREIDYRHKEREKKAPYIEIVLNDAALSQIVKLTIF